jgi:tRNA dimethylallyltransferase
MQVYRGLDIGTAKPSAADRAEIRHHLVDVADASEAFTVAEFQAAGREVLKNLSRTGTRGIICGGSGMHFRALVDPLEFPPTDPDMRHELEAADPEDLVTELLRSDPDAADHVDLANPRRVLRAVEVYRLTGVTPSGRSQAPAAVAVREYRSFIDFAAIGIDPGDRLEERVAGRFAAMIDHGWLEEVQRLGPSLGPTAKLAIGYRELHDVAARKRGLADVSNEVVQSTLAFAKRQRTYFRRDPRIRWLRWHDDPARRVQESAAALEEAGAWSL